MKRAWIIGFLLLFSACKSSSQSGSGLQAVPQPQNAIPIDSSWIVAESFQMSAPQEGGWVTRSLDKYMLADMAAVAYRNEASCVAGMVNLKLTSEAGGETPLKATNLNQTQGWTIVYFSINGTGMDAIAHADTSLLLGAGASCSAIQLLLHPVPSTVVPAPR